MAHDPTKYGERWKDTKPNHAKRCVHCEDVAQFQCGACLVFFCADGLIDHQAVHLKLISQ